MALSLPRRTFAYVLSVLACMLLTVDVSYAGRTTTTYTMTYTGSLVARSALLLLRTGDTVSVTATGLIDSSQHDPDNPWNGPEGLDAFHPTSPIPSAPHNSLIAYLGPDHTPIHLGASGTFIAPHDGELKFGANDHFPQDNQGTWTITYSVTAASPQTISITPLPDPAILGSTHQLNPVASPSLLPVTLEAWDGCTVDEHGTVTFTRIGPCLIIATQAGDFDHLPASPHEFQTTVVRKPQTVTFTSAPPTGAVVGTRYRPEAAATSGGEVIFNTNGDCSFTDNDEVVFLGMGVCEISASQYGDRTEWQPSDEVFQRITVEEGRSSQTITYTSTPPNDAVPGLSYSPRATASSGLPVTFIVTGPCSLAAHTVMFQDEGLCIITAKQQGDAIYEAAEPQQQTIAIGDGKQAQTIAFTTTPPVSPIPDSSYTASAIATSGLPVEFGVTGPCSLSANTVSFASEGLCIITAEQGGDATFAAAAPITQSINVGRSTTTLLLTATPPSAREGDPVTLIAALPPVISDGTVAFTHHDSNLCSDASVENGTATCTVTFEASGRYAVGARFSGNDTYNAATAAPLTVLVSADVSAVNVKAATSFLRHRNNMLLSSDTVGSRPKDTLHLHQNGLPVTSEPTTEQSPALNAFLSSQSIGSQRMAFSASLNDLRFVLQEREARHTENAREALGFADRWQTMTRPALLKHNVWVNAHVTTFTHTDHEPTDNTGAVAAIGYDYVISPSLLVGLFIQGDAMRSDTDNTRVEGYGGVIGPYLAAALGSHLTWQIHGGWGLSTNTLDGDGGHHTFTSERWMAMTSLTGRFQLGNWTVNPEARVAYVSDTAARTSALPELSNNMGQAKAGPRISYRHIDKTGAAFEPFAGLRITWTFADDTSTEGVVLSIDESFGPSGFRGEAEFGFNAVYPDGLSWGFRGVYDGIGSDSFSAINGSALLSIPF